MFNPNRLIIILNGLHIANYNLNQLDDKKERGKKRGERREERGERREERGEIRQRGQEGNKRKLHFGSSNGIKPPCLSIRTINSIPFALHNLLRQRVEKQLYLTIVQHNLTLGKATQHDQFSDQIRRTEKDSIIPLVQRISLLVS